MNNLNLENPQRQSLVGVGVIFFKNLRIAFNVFLSLVAVQFGLNFSIFGFGIEAIAIVLAIIFLIISFLQYRRFFFYVNNDNFIIEKGLFSRDKITVPFERIQTVNLTQNLVQRFLNVMGLKIDTAGSSEKELEIPALKKNYARELQRFLIRQKEETVEISADERVGEESISERKTPLIQLGFKDLMKVGITENHLRNGLLLFAAVNGYLWQYEEYLMKPFEGWIDEQKNFLLAQAVIIVPIMLISFVVISVLFSLIQATLRYFDLKFFVDEKGVQLVSGLLKRNEFQIPRNKIQYLKWKGNPLRKLLGIKTLVVKQAVSQEVGDRQSIRVPGCGSRHLFQVLEHFYPERKSSSYTSFKSDFLLTLQLGTWLGILPAFLMCIPAFWDWRFLVFPLIYLPVALFFIYKYQKSISLKINKEDVILRKGWVYPSRLILQFYKLQDVEFSQSIFQKRRGLASVTFFTAAGDESMPHIPVETARVIYDYCVFKIESSRRSWM